VWQIGREHEVRSQKSIAADSTGGGVPGARCPVPHNREESLRRNMGAGSYSRTVQFG